MLFYLELTVLRCSSRTVATWPVLQKKLATICFEAIFPHRTFVAFDSSSKIDTVLLFYFGLIRIGQWFVFWSTAIVFFPTFLCTNRHEPFFWAIFKLCGIQREQIFFTARCWSIECILVAEMLKDTSISRYVTWRSCIISSRTASMFSDTTAVFGRSLRT